MKKSLLFLLFTFVAFIGKAQPGLFCDSALNFPSGNFCFNDNTTSTGEFWFCFVADSERIILTATNSSDSTIGHAHTLAVFSGTCDSLVLFGFAQLTDSADTLIVFDTTAYIPGNTYWVQIKTKVGAPGCKECTRDTAVFDLCKSLDISILAPNIFTVRFDRTLCGLDYVQQSRVVTTRDQGTNPGGGIPAFMSFTSISPTANLVRAFVWFTALGNTVTPTNPLGFSFNSPIGNFNANANLLVSTGSALGTCWSFTTLPVLTNTYSYFSDVTPFVAANNLAGFMNGNYSIGGLPLNNGVFNTTGVTLMLVVSDCSDISQGPTRLIIWDGLDVRQSPSCPLIPFYNEPIAPPAFNVSLNQKAFMVIADVQTGATSYTMNNSPLTQVIPNPGTGMYNFEELVAPALPPITGGQAVMPYHVCAPNDCYAVTVFGLRIRDGNSPVPCTPLSVTAAPPVVNFCKPGPYPFVVNIGLNVTGGNPPYSYLWSPATGVACTTCQNTTVTVNGPVFTIYTVTVTDIAGCTATATVTVAPIDPPDATITGPTSNPCDGQPIIYSGPANPNVTYTWIVDYTIPIPPNADFTVTSNNPSVFVPQDGGGWTITLITCYNNLMGCCDTNTVFIDRCCGCDAGSICLNNKDANFVIANYGANLVSAGGDPIIINGILDVNQDLSFTGFDGNNNLNNVELSTNAKIIIRPGVTLTIDDCLLERCIRMWDGIYIEDQTAKLIIRNNSTVRDGKNAIVSQLGGIFELTNSTFENNYKCVVVQPFSGTHQGFIQGCTFRTNTSVMYPQALPTLPGNPVRNDVGVEINQVQQISIGNAASVAFKNFFEDMDFGIRSDRSNVTVHNAEMFNLFQNLNITFSGVGVFAKGEIPISDPSPVFSLIVGGPNPNEGVLFNNCFIGIDAFQYMNLHAEGNTLTNFLSGTGSFGIGAFTCHERTINILNNTFRRHIRAIWCQEIIDATIDIRFNKIHLTGPGGTGSGIVVENALLMPVDVKIRQNDIANTMTGIATTNLSTAFNGNRPSIRFNTISMNVANNVSGTHRGIFVRGCDNSLVEQNTVMRGPSPNNHPTIIGIWVENSSKVTVNSNIVHKMGDGIYMRGMCPASKLTCNQLFRNYNGFFLDNALIGDQFGNNMPNDNVYSNVANGPHSISDDIAGNATALFTNWTHKNTLLWFIPSSSVTGVFNLVINNTGSACDVILPPIAPPMRTSFWGAIVQNQITFPQFDPESKWQTKKQAYHYFKQNPGDITLGSPDDTTYQNFFTATSNSNIGVFANVSDEIVSGNITSATAFNNSVLTNNAVEDKRKTVNDIYLNTWAIGQQWFTASDSATLLMIANGDPAEWGDAVYSAWVMLGIDAENSNSNRINQDAFIENGIATSGGIIFPHPVKKEATLRFEIMRGQIAFLDVYSMLGEKVVSIELYEGNEHSFNIETLPDGVFVFRLLVNGEIVLSDKLVIMK